jgi:predicted outer membrane repeat protein
VFSFLGITDEFFIYQVPRVHNWPQHGVSSFTRIYDYDVVLVAGVVEWDWRVDLCTRSWLPCSLTVVGHHGSPSTIRRSANTQIACDSVSGCTGVVFEQVTVLCSNKLSSSAALQASGQGVELAISNSTFVACTSREDGGSVRVLNGAVLKVTGSLFVRSSSMANGGAVAIAGAKASVTFSSFVNCSAPNGLGGAVSIFGISPYPWPLIQSEALLQSCRFLQNMASKGGSLSVTTASTKARIASCSFDRNTATQSGGAVSISESAQAVISTSTYTANAATRSGGAVSMSESAQVNISRSSFVGNEALSMGGGAMHASQCAVELVANAFWHNSAPGGGGGALLWEGETHNSWSYSELGYNEHNIACKACRLSRFTLMHLASI